MSHVRLHDATVAIVGLGLMGSSLGLALDGRCARRIGADTSNVASGRARELGAVDEVRPATEAVAGADVVVLAMPVHGIVQVARELAPHLRDGALLTDLGSTKEAICDTFDELDAASIGGHPMCGREQSGPDAARADLFEDATWALCPTLGTDDAALQRARELARAVGAHPVRIDRAAHDRAVAVASHLPYVTAQALAAVAGDANAATDGDVSLLAASGFASATRTARGSVDMWGDVLATNAPNVRAAIAAMRTELDRIAAALDEHDQLVDELRVGPAALERIDRGDAGAASPH